MEPLEDDVIQQLISDELASWTYEKGKLQRSYTRHDFKEALAFLIRIGFEAEGQGHHPEIKNVYNRVDITLCTHDAEDRVTEKDVRLAKAIEEIFKNY